MTTKITTDNIASETLTTILGPKVSSIVYPGDDTAANTAGGDSITLLGSGFNNGASVIVNGTSAGVVTVVSSTQITFTAPAQTAGTYVIYVINSDGGTAISIPGISYSGTPTWSTSAGNIGVGYETGSISTTVTASGDAPITYSVVSGTLPTGSSLNTSSGLISGTASATASSTTYSFTIKATDAQNQDTNRAFSITVNPDVVTWSSPANSTTYEVFKDIAIANVAMSATSASGGSITYTADTLPTGLSITGANIAGTPTVAASTSTTLTATSTSTRTATRTINWVVSIANDTYFKNTTLLLNGETTVTPFISDASANSFGLTINGDTKPVLFNPYQGNGYYSNYFSGASLSVPTNAALNLGSGAYTIEGFFNTNTTAGQQTIISFLTGFKLTVISTGLRVWGDAGNTYETGTATINVNTWYHFAWVRESTSLGKLYLDGVLILTVTSSNIVSSTTTDQNVLIGTYGDGFGNGFNGYISNLRVLKGTALYTSAFTPPTTPLIAIANTSLLTCQSNRFIDNSTTNATLTINSGTPAVSLAIPFTANSSYSTYGSAYFDGTSDYLTVAANAAFTYGTSNFTIEGWHYLTAASNVTKYLFDQRVSGQGLFPAIYISSGSYIVYINSGVALTAGVVVPNVWVHWALVKNSSTTTLYVNGTSAGSFADTNNYSTTALFRIGSEWSLSGSFDWQGYMSDLRVVKGTAVYTTAFTPPTIPLTAIANTQLLTCQYNGGATNQAIIDNSNFNNIITRNGNTSQGTFSPYSVTGWSNYFDGSGDYLTINYSSGSTIAGDFTWETWAYDTFATVNGTLMGWRSGSSGWSGFIIQRNNSANLVVAINNGTNITQSNGTYLSNVWNHVALVRSGTTVTLYLNGTSVGTATISGSFNPGTSYWIGSDPYNNTANVQLQGYISNQRFVNGTAVYTAAFTPSTTPLIAIANTSLLTCQSNRFVDNSPNSFALTISGTPSVQAFGPFGSVPEAVPISYSVYFDGTGDYLATPDNVAFTLGSNDFTFECWVYPTSITNGNNNILAQWGNGNAWIFRYVAAGRPQFSGAATNVTGTTTAVTINQWNHVAITRTSGTVRLFVNGVLDATTGTIGALTDGASQVTIGAYSDGTSEYVTGYISNLRLINGTSLYTSTFTPSTTPLTAIANTSLLTCQSTTMIDNSTNRFTITANGNVTPRIFNPFGYTAQSATSYTPSLHGGSIYLDGTGDYLTIANSASFNLISDFTFECWIYNSSVVSGETHIFGKRASIAVYSQIIFGLNVSSGVNKMFVIGTTASGSWNIPLTLGSITLPIGQWNHISLVRSGTTIKTYINGVVDITLAGVTGSFFTNADAMTIGTSTTNGSAGYYTGYISDFRFVNATAIYTSNFIPPTTSLTSTANASLLCNFNNGGIIDQHGTNVFETIGNTQLSTSVKKYNNSSLYFDGTGDYLQRISPPLVMVQWWRGSFTIEYWIYANTFPQGFNSESVILGNMGPTGTGTYWSFGPVNSGIVRFYYYNGSIQSFTTASALSTGQWYHLAFVNNAGALAIYINGVSSATASVSGTPLAGSDLPLAIGSSNSVSFNGYIDDLRITSGVARYTSNFTAPTSAFITK